jgi:hypothetical protein
MSEPTDPQPGPSQVPVSLSWHQMLVTCVLWTAALAWFLSQTLHRALTVQNGVDFGKHWIAARVLLDGGSPYQGDLFLSFNYPLFVGFLYLPLALFDQAETVFDFLNSLWVLLAMLAIIVGLRPSPAPLHTTPLPGTSDARLTLLAYRARTLLAHHWGPAVLFLAGSSQSLQRLIWSGNVDGLNVLVLSLFAVLVIHHRDHLAGLALAALALIKVAPILFLIPMAGLRRWSLILVALATLAGYWLLLALTGWASTETELYRRVLPAIPWHWRHISIGLHTALVEQFIGWDSITEGQYRRLVFGMNAAMMCALVAICALNWRRLAPSPARVLILSYPAFLGFSPLLELIHLSWMLPALFIGLREWAESRVRPAPFFAWLFVWLVVLHLDILSQHGAMAFGASLTPHLFKTMAVLAAIGTGLWFALSNPPPATTPKEA